ncbi:hypothetical protein HRG_004195 [Hirsutella rhossiliensis]|uniref:DUF952 domain-containing protein n=1 Tax=Hirsutella rhossiliensis TaxID=111463 RepID=A0A9P8MYQ4_9HYPO|nr:uncharacterized protein HRG_04195 [Hirsutella rhossiliensis]KAH0963767.1 hypothetical protein HRG_04195 [Hirsutella rhossiliensis]
MEQVKHVYKILPSAPQDPIPAEYPFSDLDKADGFVHLSTSNQVPATADLFFAAASSLWLLKFDLGNLADSVIWEDGFPHLYGNFGAKDVHSVRKFERAERQSWADSMRDSSWLN